MLPNENEPPYFNRKSVRPSHLYRDVGRSAERPFMILGTLLETSLGDLLAKTVFLSTLKDQFDHARLIVRYSDVRPYSAEVISLSPNIDHATPLKGERPRWLAEWFPDMRPWRPLARWTLGRERLPEAFYDLVVIEPMMDVRMVHGLEQPVALRIPPEREDALQRQLVGLGLDPARWYATIHYRASNYGPKLDKSPMRNGEPESYRQLVDYIIDELGGQVVQLGHPEMEPFPARPGFVDLSRLKDGFMLQAYSVCHSRFLVAGPSGPVMLGFSFQVPLGVVDATDGYGGWGDREQVILTHEVTTPEGKVLSNRALLESGLLDKVELNRRIREGGNYRIRKNSGAELAAIARHLFERTADITGWRPALQQPARIRPNHFIWPPKTHENMRFFGE
jgi:putative glycosyltransferase (TIGR04372 family)